jgi:hypothetical protein
MKKPLFPRLAALLIAVALVGASGPPALAVIGGQVDDGTPPKFPNVGCLVIVSQNGAWIMPFDGGSVSLVHPRVALTAGHIADNAQTLIAAGVFDLADARVSFGVDPLDPAGWLEVEAFVTHPQFAVDPGNFTIDYDVGLIVLKERVEGVQPVTLAPAGFLDQLRKSGALLRGETRFTVVGYGDDRAFAPPAGVETAPLRRFAQAVFGGVTAKWLTLLDNPEAHEGGIWVGDSGGPAFWADPATGAQVQVGVASWANLVTLSQFARTDLPETRGFIDAVVAEVEDADAAE